MRTYNDLEYLVTQIREQWFNMLKRSSMSIEQTQVRSILKGRYTNWKNWIRYKQPVYIFIFEEQSFPNFWLNNILQKLTTKMTTAFKNDYQTK